ncbi:glycosyltransferase [Candidatus Haliotispira prima]|uniref:Glycosyltransferase n=1 Tax=Candidatus Haliotispira prima TaxID=3034016 RepID=A0ABY8MGN6_9SPIO|nr:glycosyltransferase [Candidatus Haliotispira prima]
MTQALISIIVPVYNVEKYLAQAMDSLLSQTHTDLEILLLNDGSTDTSAVICEDYAGQDSRIIYIEKANEGYGKTVNIGLREAKGEYIAIFEPDDWLEPEMYGEMLMADQKGESEFIRCSYQHVDENGHNIQALILLEESLNLYGENSGGDRKKTRLTSLEEEPCLSSGHPAIWTCLFRTEFLRQHGIYCTETPGAAFQDIGFYLQCAIYAKRVTLLNKRLYNYRIHPNQSVQKLSVKNILYEVSQLEARWSVNYRRPNLTGQVLATKLTEALTAELSKVDLFRIPWNEVTVAYRESREKMLSLPENLVPYLLNLPSKRSRILSEYLFIRRHPSCSVYFLRRPQRVLVMFVKWLLRKFGLFEPVRDIVHRYKNRNSQRKSKLP